MSFEKFKFENDKSFHSEFSGKKKESEFNPFILNKSDSLIVLGEN